MEVLGKFIRYGLRIQLVHCVVSQRRIHIYRLHPLILVYLGITCQPEEIRSDERKGIEHHGIIILELDSSLVLGAHFTAGIQLFFSECVHSYSACYN